MSLRKLANKKSGLGDLIVMKEVSARNWSEQTVLILVCVESVVCEICGFSSWITGIMDVFSLEEDSYEGLFLTQTSSVQQDEIVNDRNNSDLMELGGDREDDGTAPNFSNAAYSDISDVEDFDIPSSQIQGESHR